MAERQFQLDTGTYINKPDNTREYQVSPGVYYNEFDYVLGDNVTTFYIFHPFINSDDANTKIQPFGQFWENTGFNPPIGAFSQGVTNPQVII